MRVTNSMYYDSIYGNNNSKLNRKLFDVNKQIASGLKIQYAKDDVRTFTETMRLDNEVTVLKQIKQSTQSGYKMANQTDEVMNEFQTSINRMRTLLIQAANETNSDTSRDAIADELRGIEKNLKGLANTSINGQFLFAGSAVDTKPIADDGTYNGNDHAMNAFVGANNKQQYNLSGADLFLGEEILRKREITSNVVNGNLIDNTKSLTPDSTLRELMGDKDNNAATANTDYFYLRGTKHDGSAIKEKISLQDTATISTLLDRIGTAYGNTGTVNVVDVSMNSDGQIVVKDKISGSSKLDFQLVGAVDFSGGSAADVTDIDNLDSGETTYPPAGNLYVKEFMKSNLNPAAGAAANIEGLVYDRTLFSKDGLFLSSNAPQVLKNNNAFATPSTKISEVADLSQGNAGTLDGSSLNLVGTDVNGGAYDVTINFQSTVNGGSTFTDNNTGTSYNIFNMDATRTAVNADDMTYQQLMDVVNMVVTNTLPSANTATAYDTAIDDASLKGNTYLSYDGKLSFHDLQGTDVNGTQASISLYDPNSDDFTAGAASSIMTFNTNNALTITDPKTDFFSMVDEMITAVEDHKLYPDSRSGHVRNVGIENAIQKIDDLQDHVLRMHAKVGAQSNTLNTSLERTQILEVSTMSLRSEVVDTDLAESSLRLQQLTTNYQAMLSTVGRISKLSLVNYL
ncbi:flagellar biosynthesis protein FlgL [Sulfurimonas paralvinellae]|uniref:Flagellar biosynthesis protein FlgL n=1 Tax=Sulfurimonas paralvinellae TaxID=317658 RepID=A0A7M1BA58_9BACT|nr:flagellar biosynthesis protein FlgL [Sulfurimonas paralvinellae]QOP45718.1 flagellar biosynthesis protein FlgL [Sulfurimonas paralvinellae]